MSSNIRNSGNDVKGYIRWRPKYLPKKVEFAHAWSSELRALAESGELFGMTLPEVWTRCGVPLKRKRPAHVDSRLFYSSLKEVGASCTWRCVNGAWVQVIKPAKRQTLKAAKAEKEDKVRQRVIEAFATADAKGLIEGKTYREVCEQVGVVGNPGYCESRTLKLTALQRGYKLRIKSKLGECRRYYTKKEKPKLPLTADEIRERFTKRDDMTLLWIAHRYVSWHSFGETPEPYCVTYLRKRHKLNKTEIKQSVRERSLMNTPRNRGKWLALLADKHFGPRFDKEVLPTMGRAREDALLETKVKIYADWLSEIADHLKDRNRSAANAGDREWPFDYRTIWIRLAWGYFEFGGEI